MISLEILKSLPAADAPREVVVKLVLGDESDEDSDWLGQPLHAIWVPPTNTTLVEAAPKKATPLVEAAPKKATPLVEAAPKKAMEKASEPSQKKQTRIIDLTVDDLKDYEINLDTTEGKFLVKLGSNELRKEAPKIISRGAGGRIKFDNPTPEWQSSKTWEFIQIQSLVNVLTTVYGLVPLGGRESVLVSRAENCAGKLGYISERRHTKDHMKEHIKKWLPKFLHNAFIPYMAMLEGLLSPAALGYEITRKNYKLAKSALKHNRFPPVASARLQVIINTVVDSEEQWINEKKAAAGAEQD